MNVLYISYDGLTDPLGKSQVLPYVIGLSHKGYSITILSYEKRGYYDKFKEEISMLLVQCGIQWKPLQYHSGFSVLSTLFNVLRGMLVLRKIVRPEKIQIVHCRSYISAFLGLFVKKKYQTKFVFDMRGFWADERKEAGMISIAPVYLLMKKFEKKFLLRADAIISLTDAGIEEMKSWGYMSSGEIQKCTQISTCCDAKKYNGTHEINSARQVNNNAYKFVYVGSIGPWHSLEELCSFMSFTYQYLPNSSFTLIVNQGNEHLHTFIKNNQLDASRFSIQSISHGDIPKALENFDIGFFFIPPKYSKTASSPTKMGEMLSAGLPIITGHSIGDVDSIIRLNDIGYAMKSFEDKSYKEALDHVTGLISMDRQAISKRCLQVANTSFSLDKAVTSYANIYSQLLQ